MSPLDKPQDRQHYDRAGIYRAIELLPEQAKQAWAEARRIVLPAPYRRAREAVMSGMGGSGLAGHLIESAFRDRLRAPFFLLHGEEAPHYLGPETLVFLSSYSGTTEEVLNFWQEARQRRAKLLGLTSGGDLGQAITRGALRGYRFSPTYNPGDKPRFGLGYLFFGLLGLLRAARLLPLSAAEMSDGFAALREAVARFGVNRPQKINLAKQLAENFHQRIPIFLGPVFLEDSARIIANQTHETAKQFAFHFALPELNHHLMEGLKHPAAVRRNLVFLMLDSSLLQGKMSRRLALTREIIKKHRLPLSVYRPRAKTRLGQIAEILVFGSFLSYYLGLLNRLDPAPNPWVDYFKQRLGR